MTRAKVRVTFDFDGAIPRLFEKDIDLGDLREPGGNEYVAQRVFSELEANSAEGTYYSALPSVEKFLRPSKQTFRIEELFSGSYEDRINTREMWIEIGSALLRAGHLLALSGAYHDQELVHSSSQSSESTNLSWHFHLDKMERFDLAAVTIGRLSDLTARLVFERLGAPSVDQTKPDWERDINLALVRKVLADRTGNPHVASLTDAEYNEVREILDDFFKTDNVMRLCAYRIKFVHRIRPSVDRPELYTHLESRKRTPITDSRGNKGWTRSIGGMPTTPAYAFTDLFEDAAQTLRHYIALLERLEAIPIFGIDAAASSVSA